MEKKMIKRLKKLMRSLLKPQKLSATREMLIMSLAWVDACEEMIPEETRTDILKEIIDVADQLTTEWDRVWALAEKRLRVIEEVERMVC